MTVKNKSSQSLTTFIDVSTIHKIDRLVDNGYFGSRSELVRNAIHPHIKMFLKIKNENQQNETKNCR